MRVIHSLDEYLPATQNWAYPQITRVPGVQAAVICRAYSEPEEFPIDGGLFCEWKASGQGGPNLMIKIGRKLGLTAAWAELRARRWRPELIHAHFGNRGWEMLRLARQANVPLVTSFYGFDAYSLPQREPQWCSRFGRLFEAGALFLVEGPAMKKRLIEIGCEPSKVTVRTLGVDLRRLRFEKREMDGRLRIVMVGRFVPKKGLVDGLHACAIASEAGRELEVTIVGDATASLDSLAIKHALRTLAASPALDGKVRFVGSLSPSETIAVVGRHNVMICPSRHAPDGDAEGGLPFVMTEAMALGLLCIGSRHCDTPEAVIDEVTGYLVDEGDVRAIARRLLSLPESREKMAEIQASARRHVQTKYDVDVQLAVLGDIYRSTIEEYRTHSVNGRIGR